MNVDWDRICDFVFDTFGDDNAEMARYSLIEFGIDPDTRRPIVNEDYTPRVHTVSCGCVVCRRQRRRTPRAADSAPPYTSEELDVITDPRRNGALQDPPSR